MLLRLPKLMTYEDQSPDQCRLHLCFGADHPIGGQWNHFGVVRARQTFLAVSLSTLLLEWPSCVFYIDVLGPSEVHFSVSIPLFGLS